MFWINSLKVAIIEKDIQSISDITSSLPKFYDLKEAEEALSLIREAIRIVETQKNETLTIMKKIKQTKFFLAH